jgi:hypothetical protein
MKAMTGAGKQLSVRRGLCLNAALSLLFFLVFSAPHRVHHVFERVAIPSATARSADPAHDHSSGGDRNHHDPGPPASKQDCVVFSVAQAAHGSLVSLITLPVFQNISKWREDHRAATVISCHFSPASPRAPPQL